MEIKELAEQLVNLTVKEVNELAKILKDEYGIEPAAAAPVMVAGENAGAGAAAEEKSSFNVILSIKEYVSLFSILSSIVIVEPSFS